jgi:predicted dehydrogenase
MFMLYRVNAAPLPADSWVLDPEIGGGAIVAEVCHFIDYLTFINGSMPRSVHASGLRELRAGETVSILLSFANGSVGTVLYGSNGSSALPKERVEVSSAGITAILTDFRELEVYSGKRVLRKKSASQDKGQANMLNAFVEALREGRESPIPFEEIEAVSRATFAALESLRSGAPVTLRRSI